MRSSSSIVLIVSLGLLLAGCGPQAARGPYLSGTAMGKLQHAEACYQQARPLCQIDPEQAEGLLREALLADPRHGPAHAELGALLLDQDRLYAAATELAWACRLMPGDPGPRILLGITLEKSLQHQQTGR